MALGEILRNAREQKGCSASAVAESTHLKVQVVEDLEREDFRRIAAPIYGRGFVKLYAEFLQLDPEPLIRDFMELYAGARSPAVRMKRTEAPSEPQQQGGAPVTRTVTGPAAAAPQRQTVQPKPAVRPLSAPLQNELAEDTPVVMENAAPAPVTAYESPAEDSLQNDPVAELHSKLVVEPEEPFVESEEPDLFRPQSKSRRPRVEDSTPDESRLSRKMKMPVFKVGGRMEETRGPEVQDAASHERRRLRIQAFIDGVSKLKDGIERKLPASALPRKQVLALCGAGVAMLVVMSVGIGMLFRMTGANVKVSGGTAVEALASPPDLYVD
jgi:cytoskeletal protein RodZ